MNKLKYIFFAVVAIALFALTAFAQGAADNESTLKASNQIGIGLGVLGFGLAAGLAGIGQGLVGNGATQGAARNPGAAGTVQTMMIIALALIESLVLFALLIVFLKIKLVD
jgi:F-type H+-transporting ATPase subunit c